MPLETGDHPFNQRKTVTPRTREAVEAYLAFAKQPAKIVTNVTQLTDLFSDIGDEAIPAFIERLHGEDEDERLAVSAALLETISKHHFPR